MRTMLRRNWPLVLILGISFILRVWGINFGLPFFLHPDETKIVEPAISMAFGLKEALLAGNIDHFNPNFFFYPSLLMYLLMLKIVGLKLLFVVISFFSLGKVSFDLVTKPDLYLLARLISVFFGTASVYITYLLGRRLANKSVGLLSALLLGLNFFHALNSHYYTGDVGSVFFTLLAFLFLFHYWDGLKDRWLYLSALFIGFGMATKYYPVLMLLPLSIVVFSNGKSLGDKVAKLFLSGFIALATFVLLVPFSVLNFSQFITEMEVSSQRSSTGVFGFMSDSFWYYLTSQDSSFIEPFTQNSLLQGLGIVFLGFFLMSLIVYSFKRERHFILLILYVVIHYVFFATHLAKIQRWLLPLAPLAGILVACLLYEIHLRFKSKGRFLVLFVLLSILIPNVWRIVTVNYALSREDTRSQAYEWTERNIPEGSRVVFEYFSIAQFTRRDLQFFEFDHPRYNINGEIAMSRPPDYEWLRNYFQPQFIVVNGDLRDRYKTESMQRLFPETSQAWLEMYDNIDRDYKVAARFSPSLYDNVRAGPEMVIFVPK